MAKKNKNSGSKSGAPAAEKSPREQETSEASTGAEDAATVPVASASVPVEPQSDATSSAPAAAEVESLRQRLDAANQEIAALKAQLAQRDAEVAALKAGGAGGGLSGLAPTEDIQSLQVRTWACTQAHVYAWHVMKSWVQGHGCHQPASCVFPSSSV